MYTIFGQKVKFNINKEKRIVTAYIEHVNCLFMSVYDKYYTFGKNEIDEISVGGIYNYLSSRDMIANRFTAKAICSENDEWNDEIGKELAFVRLYGKVINAFEKAIEIYRRVYLDQFDMRHAQFTAHITKTTQNIMNHDKKYLAELGYKEK